MGLEIEEVWLADIDAPRMATVGIEGHLQIGIAFTLNRGLPAVVLGEHVGPFSERLQLANVEGVLGQLRKDSGLADLMRVIEPAAAGSGLLGPNGCE